jgi:DNA-binding CsgD family transcriptional regulator
VSYAARGRGSKMRPSNGWDSLSRAERDIVKLVIEGMTNQEISEKLFVSVRTVGTHLTHVYRKLGVGSRRELAREAGQRTIID